MSSVRGRLAGSASFFAAAVSMAVPAYAQDDQSGDAQGDVIIVSSSRIDAAGFDAPTPTVHLDQGALSIGGRANVAASLADLPQFRASTSPQTTGTNTGAGQAPVDLRGLGNNRTLVLMDGRRFSSENDLNTVPSIMIKGLDVVTGGASAAWGSGAVAGVVNIQIDNEYEGLLLGASAGLSTSYGDDFEYRFEGKYGTSFDGGRGHFVIGGEYYDSEGVIPKVDRPRIGRWANFNGTITPDVGYGNMAYGGLITSGVLAGQAFNNDGSLRDYDYGYAQAGNFSAGGEGPSNDDWSPLVTPQRRYSGLASLTYEITPSIQVTAQVRHSRMYNDYIWFGDNIQGSQTSGQWINADNAFLSQGIRDQLSAAGEDGFYLGRANRDLSYSYIDFERKTTQGTLAFDGTFSNGFRWSAYYSHGEYQNNIDTPGFLLSENFANAVDAVFDGNGNIVCRSGAEGCVPVNLFGFGSPSDEAISYVTGTPSQRAKTKLDVGGISLRGEPISLPAGDVSFSIGGEIRHEAVNQTVGELDAAKAFRTFSFSSLSGGYTVSEGFAEVAVPLIYNTPLLQQLNLNAAARYSHYSTTGGIWSWKIGATNEFFPGFVGRVTRSRDIRSANLTELYNTQTTGYNTIQNPFRRNADGTPISEYVLSNGGGNPDLTPEKANTWTVGATYAPPMVPGLNLSLDYYNIDIDDVIDTIASQDVITRCYNGNAALCDRIDFGPDNSIQRTVSTYVNLANYKTDGIDGQIDYKLPVYKLGFDGNGQLHFNVKGTWVNSLTIDDGESTIEYVRSQGYTFGDGVPKWRVNATAGYESEGVSGLIRARYISPGEFNSSLDITNNHIGAYTYFDGQLSFNVKNDSGPDMELYINASNLFNKKPPYGSLYSPYYDVIGRFVSVGARVKL
ncbi:TonB-dependent receptor domain-containing protein [Novosphingobium sp. BW1]|uniref:TonB-dependent receptor domain-containing protein n=1 Tax=Novosphingobium sp. BW1 TaxID=2592621 RepID=UPI0011DEEE43|nr:TonB-dependent receptor [Novosphingobium sp. BW1]TYC92937.1 TonB-dependent receptor [Novosphingobium sp. BW1]